FDGFEVSAFSCQLSLCSTQESCVSSYCKLLTNCQESHVFPIGSSSTHDIRVFLDMPSSPQDWHCVARLLQQDLKAFRDIHVRIGTLFVIWQARSTPPASLGVP
ncbi:hypothetical protein C8Q74DRAFT_592473, partial [Fomes fomentarius]